MLHAHKHNGLFSSFHLYVGITKYGNINKVAFVILLIYNNNIWAIVTNGSISNNSKIP